MAQALVALLLLATPVSSSEVQPPPPAPPPEESNEPHLTRSVIGLSIALGFTLALLLAIALRRVYRRRHRRTLPPLSEAPSSFGSDQSRRILVGNSSLPTCEWAAGRRFCCFLSHYKDEAGSDARYLHDVLGRIIGAPVFLDSNNLSDLRGLFRDGVHQSDVLVLLATKNVLTRPWCLLEVHEAVKAGVPVVVLPVASGSIMFEFEAASELLGDLETQLERVNPGAVAELRQHVSDLDELVDNVRRAVLNNNAAQVHFSSGHSRVNLFTAVRKLHKAHSMLNRLKGGGSRLHSSVNSSRHGSRHGTAHPEAVHVGFSSSSMGDSRQSSLHDRRPSAVPAMASASSSLGETEPRLPPRPVTLRASSSTLSAGDASPKSRRAPRSPRRHVEKALWRARLQWRPNGTDNQIAADLCDLVEQMASVSGRQLEWHRRDSYKSGHALWSRSSSCESATSREASTNGREISRGERSFAERTLEPSMFTKFNIFSRHNTDREPSEADRSSSRVTTRERSEEEDSTPARSMPSRRIRDSVCRRMGRVVVNLPAMTSASRSNSDNTPGRELSEGALGTDGASRFGAIIACVDAESGREARYLQQKLEMALGRPLIVAAVEGGAEAEAGEAGADAHGARAAASAKSVAESDALLLLQTASTLTTPSVLLEVFVAVRLGLPIVPIRVVGKGYDFSAAKTLLADLRGELPRRDPAALDLLGRLLGHLEPPATVDDVASALVDAVPNMISVEFNPLGTDHAVAASIRDVVDKLRRVTMEPASPTPQHLHQAPSASPANAAVPFALSPV